MAFPAAAGWNNLPNGAFSPTIYSKKVQKRFRKSSVVQDISNTDYFGEIANMGDSVQIIKEPTITVKKLERGTALETEDLNDVDFSLVIDQANYFQFGMDDLETAHSHVNFMELATDEAAYKMRDAFDAEVLGYAAGWEQDGSGDWVRRTAANGTKSETSADNDELFAAHKLDITRFGGADLGVEAEATSIPVAPNGGAGAVTSPLQILNRINRLMDQKNIPAESRWVVLDPIMIELLMDEDSKLVSGDYGASGNELKNGVLWPNLRGFKVYKSNNLPFIGGGAEVSASGGSETDFGVILAGHKGGFATAEQLAKTESFRSPTGFQDKVRGMQLYGRKILRPDSLFTAIYNIA